MHEEEITCLFYACRIRSDGTYSLFIHACNCNNPHSYTMPYPPLLFPKQLYLNNFMEAWNSNHFGNYFFNSIFISILSTVVIILVSCMSAYGFARMQFPGKNVVFTCFSSV